MPFDFHPMYQYLPTPIQFVVTPEEYAWLSDNEKARLIEDYCNPEHAEDDEI